MYKHIAKYILKLHTGVFSLATNFNNGGEPLDWDVSNVENMDSLFAGAIRFDQDVSDWDISNVTSMIGMFNTAHAFNNGGEALDWGEKTQNVENMQQVFSGTRNFNQEVNDWNTSSVTNMSNMFWNNTAFNQPLNNWDTSQVTDMHSMFANTTQFNQDVSDFTIICVQSNSRRAYSQLLSNITNLQNLS